MLKTFLLKQTSVLVFETFKMSVQMSVKEYMGICYTQESSGLAEEQCLGRVFQPRGELEDAFKNIVHLIQWKISR